MGHELLQSKHVYKSKQTIVIATVQIEVPKKVDNVIASVKEYKLSHPLAKIICLSGNGVSKNPFSSFFILNSEQMQDMCLDLCRT